MTARTTAGTTAGTTQNASGIEIVPLSDALGAELRGIDLNSVDDSAFTMIHEAWLDNLVLLFRDQALTDQALVDFSRRFGTLYEIPPNEKGTRAQGMMPQILVVSNLRENGIAIGVLGDDEARWHTDMNYISEPAMASALFAREVPEVGGDTGFCNMYQAYEGLPQALRDKVRNLAVKHDASTTSAGRLREGYTETTDVSISPGTVHPMVVVHPETNREALYLGRRLYSYIPDLPVAESEALLDEIWESAVRSEYTWHHQWRVGDVLIWDNRCTMHRRDAFDPKARRHMRRTQIKGARPIPV